ncbi:hypothetical protein BPOR_0031g00290 [Botrytis porri]|uniref:Uncharacterized protein n=1 Tax=Botrytis porri TaxID=87229 RepID=A0A4Z1L3G3_9HELO|nr:hypothetical protein BPOR_0031g00290 [Botrytis porri]
MFSNRSSGSGNPTGSRNKENETKEEQNKRDDAAMEAIVMKPTIQSGLRNREKSMNPNSPGKKIVQEKMDQYAKEKKEKKKKEVQAGMRKS